MTSDWSLKSIRRAYTVLSEPEEYVHFARVYWALLLAVTALLMLGSVAFGAWEFLVPVDTVKSAGPAQQGIVGFNREQLDKVVAGFEKRRGDFEAMMTGE